VELLTAFGTEPGEHGRREPCSARFARAPFRVLVHPCLVFSASKFNRQTGGRFVTIRPTVGLPPLDPGGGHTREKPIVRRRMPASARDTAWLSWVVHDQ
jgi:hypothetical protein